MIRKSILIALVFAMFLTAGCAQQQPQPVQRDVYYQFTDDTGAQVTLSEPPKKVVSLMGSYAETWLLAGGELAGVTDDMISERHMQVAPQTKIIGTVKEPNIEELLLLSPDFVLLSSNIESHMALSPTLQKAGVPHAYFDVKPFDDYLRMLDICTDITDRKDLYQSNGIAVQASINETLSQIPRDADISVLLLRAFSTGANAKSGDDMAATMLRDMGTVNIADQYPSLLENLSLETIIEEDPDYIFVVTMGESSEKALEALRNGIQNNPAWNSLSAVKNDRYILLPKELFHYKPNARWGESYQYLAKILYPKQFK